MEEILDSNRSKVELNLAVQGKRFANFFIDFIVINCMMLFIVLFGGLFQTSDFVITVILIVLMLVYYTFSEYAFGKTVGKYFTKTRVVTEQGERMRLEQCIKRSLSRLLLIEVFSFIPEYPIGWHDKWSKTRVVSDDK